MSAVQKYERCNRDECKIMTKYKNMKKLMKSTEIN